MSRDERAFFKVWPLSDCRDTPQENPAAHQAKALGRLDSWFEKRGRKGGAGILVLPTGGGKTFTAVRFLADGPLSDGYKVLWLAHTHHLLEQAFHCFVPRRIGGIREPRRQLGVRVVSGTPGHFAPRHIEATDDVVIGTLQTISTAVKDGLGSMEEFLDAAGKKLFVVFDEAHHAPAPTYRRLVQDLQARGAPVLGLTATPIHADETKQGWLKKVFPDNIIAQAFTNELIAAGVLARPHAVQVKTSYAPTFESRDYAKWLGTFKDIPEHVIDSLAQNAERNDFIAQSYVDDRKKFGKTIIFTDRWYQCEAIVEALAKRGVKAGAVYSHVDGHIPTARQRQKRDADENTKVLQAFRDNRIDVLLNVRMLTEGTDIPDAQTVFITRQTTSRILLTQMVGRALRGPKFGGTAEAYIVSFEDDWRQQIQWAGFELEDGEIGEDAVPRGKRPPLQLISIELVKRLAQQMSDGSNIASAPFQDQLPVGWYNVLFDARAPSEDDVEPMDLLVMVYADERKGFEKLVAQLRSKVPEELADESVTLEDHQKVVEKWRETFLPEAGRNPADLDAEILRLARHVAQRGTAPQFFEFEVRADHDLDVIATDHVKLDLGPRAIDEKLRYEFGREDRFWRTLYYRFDQYRNSYDGCVARILAGPQRPGPSPVETQKATLNEVTEAVKEEVKKRDGSACLACGTTRRLEVDHVLAVYSGGSNEPSNLQTLCNRCNLLKTKRHISFRKTASPLTQAPDHLPDVDRPSSEDAANPEAWERFLRRTTNFFFQCAAVSEVKIAGRGDGYYNWKVVLRSGNPDEWMEDFVDNLLERIQRVREAGGKPLLEKLEFLGPDDPK